ncbi:MAG: DUF2267 domain-containing protein [Dehalococcoidia bacterium]
MEGALDYVRFLSEVQANGSFTSREETEGTVASVLMALSEVLPGDQLQALAARLPPEAMVYLRRSGSEPDPLFDSHLFLGWVVSSMDSTGKRDETTGGLDMTASYSGAEAIRRAQCVFAALKKRIEPDHQQMLAALLPEEVNGWFLNA